MKIEFDLPEFDREISINVVIRKDGGVVYAASSSSDSMKPKEIPNLIVDDNDKVVPQVKPEITEPIQPPVQQQPEKPKMPLSGNFMDPSLFN